MQVEYERIIIGGFLILIGLVLTAVVIHPKMTKIFPNQERLGYLISKEKNKDS